MDNLNRRQLVYVVMRVAVVAVFATVAAVLLPLGAVLHDITVQAAGAAALAFAAFVTIAAL